MYIGTNDAYTGTQGNEKMEVDLNHEKKPSGHVEIYTGPDHNALCKHCGGRFAELTVTVCPARLAIHLGLTPVRGPVPGPRMSTNFTLFPKEQKMGLQIAVATNIRKASPDVQAEVEAAPNSRHAARMRGCEVPFFEDFPERCAGLEPDVAYAAQCRYVPMGAYSHYNWWRDKLAHLAGVAPIEKFWKESREKEKWGPQPDIPFAELLFFYDDRGTLGPEACARLARDFEEHDEKAQGYGESFYRLYSRWRDATAEAASGFIRLC